MVYLREGTDFADVLAADLEKGPLRRRLPTVTLRLPDRPEIQGTGELVTTAEGWDLVVNPTTAYSHNFFSPGAITRSQAWRATGQFADPNTFRIKPVWPPHAAQMATGAQANYQSLTLSIHRITIPYLSANSSRASYRTTHLHASFPHDQFLFAGDWVPRREEVPGFGTLETRSLEVFQFSFDGIQVAVRNHKKENRFEVRIPGGILRSRRRLAAIQSAFSFLSGYRCLASQLAHTTSVSRYSDELIERRPQKRLHNVPFHQRSGHEAVSSVSLLCEFFLHHPISEQVDSLIYNVQSVAGGSDDGQALLFCAALEGLINALATHHNMVEQIVSADVGYAEARTRVREFVNRTIQDANGSEVSNAPLTAGLTRILSQINGRPRLRDLYNALVAHYGLPVAETDQVFAGWTALRSRRAHGDFGANANWVETYTHCGWVAFGVYALILKECGFTGPVWALTLPEQTVPI